MRKFTFEKPTKLSREQIENTLGDYVDVDNCEELYIEGDIYIGTGVCFIGKLSIQKNVTIQGGCIIEDSKINSKTVVRLSSYIYQSTLSSESTIGPFAFVRETNLLGKNSIVGSHVEIVRSQINSQLRASHHCFIGDAILSSHVTIGAGVVFSNSDGKKKYTSIIGENSFIGSNSVILSPVKIGKNSIIGAGSFVNKDIDKDTVFIQRR